MVTKRQNSVDIIKEKIKSTSLEFCDTSHMDQASQYKFIIHLKEGIKMEEVKKSLANKGIFCGGGVYEVPCHSQPVFSNLPTNQDELKVTTKNCPMHICPPITSGTSNEESIYMAEQLKLIL